MIIIHPHQIPTNPVIDTIMSFSLSPTFTLCCLKGVVFNSSDKHSMNFFLVSHYHNLYMYTSALCSCDLWLWQIEFWLEWSVSGSLFIQVPSQPQEDHVNIARAGICVTLLRTGDWSDYLSLYWLIGLHFFSFSMLDFLVMWLHDFSLDLISFTSYPSPWQCSM